MIQGARVAVWAFLTISVMPQAPTWRSAAMRKGCALPADSAAERQADEAWVKSITAFLPEPSPPSLRITSLSEETQQVLLAKNGLRRTCSEYRAGKTNQADADNILSGFEQTIRDYQDSVDHEALANAKSGQVSQMPAIKNALTKVASIGRQAGLLGLDEIEDNARRTLMQSLTVFDSALAAGCMDQTFDADVIFGLMRQEGAVGMHNDIEHCAYRRATADYADAQQSWTIHHCGPGYGEWKIAAKGWLTGSGSGQTDTQGNGEFSVQYTQLMQFTTDGIETGTLKFYCTPAEACDCARSPGSEACIARYHGQVPPTQWLLDFGPKGVSGAVKMPNASVPLATIIRTGAFANRKQTPVTYKKVDKPCDPAKSS